MAGFKPWTFDKIESVNEIKNSAECAASNMPEINSIEAHIDQRYWLLRKANEHWRTALLTKFGAGTAQDKAPAPEFNDDMIFDLSMLDLFVEKAQFQLDERAQSNQRTGMYCTCAAIALLLGSAALLFFRSASTPPPDIWPTTVYRIVATSGIVGLVLGAVYILLMIARASFHEDTVLRNRLHSLRLGRLFLYLKLTSAATAHELRELKRDLKAQEVEAAFGWNLETSSAYKDIKGEGATSTLMGQVMQTVQKGIEAIKPNS